ncbi:MAG: spore coat associated protein CotJA [Eubacteriaceae bacterium]|nr:spore coat associated protein CotJA [Eubacteriaceae bacterium]
MNKQEPYVGMPINLLELEALPLGCPKDTSEKQKQTMVLAMAYVPWQRFEKTYDLNEALDVGTIFPELDLPFLGYKGGMRR